MRLAAVISRATVYKLVGPIIEHALQQGAEVDCWHDYGHPSEGPKAYQFPSIGGCPSFLNGAPAVRTFKGPDELAAGLSRGAYDAVLSIGTKQSDVGERLLPDGLQWCLVQTGVDTFLMHSPDSLLTCDLLLVLTSWWLDWADRYYRSIGIELGEPLSRQLGERVVVTGWAEIGALSRIDASDVRRRWGIPHDRRVVLLLPFPQGVGKRTFWPRYVFGEPRRVMQTVNILRHGRLEYLRDVRRGWSDAAVVQAIRTFCDRNDAFLLVKSREKTPIPGYIRDAADKALYDEGYYPPTILEAMAVASLCINYYSLSVLEAAATGVPNLCVTFDRNDYIGDEAQMRIFFDQFFVAEEGSAFQYSGVSTTIGIGDAIAELPGRSLGEFRIEPEAHRAYLNKFVGERTGAAAALAFDAIARARCLG